MSPPINPTFCQGGGHFYTVVQTGGTQMKYGGLAETRRKRLGFSEVKVVGIGEVEYWKRRTPVEKVSRNLHGEPLSLLSEYQVVHAQNEPAQKRPKNNYQDNKNYWSSHGTRCLSTNYPDGRDFLQHPKNPRPQNAHALGIGLKES